MILLTYRKADGYQAGHINAYLTSLRDTLGEKLIAYAWVSEIQKRGAVHYHLVVVTAKGARIPLPDKSGMWPHGWSGIHTARTPWYLITYTGKERQKDLARYPRSARLYAASLRGLPDESKASFRMLSGFSVVEKNGEVVSDVGEGKFFYLGSTVTAGYARDVLLPSDAVV